MGIDAKFMVVAVEGCCVIGGGGDGFTQVAIDVGGDLVAVGLWVFRFSLSD